MSAINRRMGIQAELIDAGNLQYQPNPYAMFQSN